ncbi:MAG: hypothetical protein N4J56_006701 [Chroococcidiopsis sp. SAG 2025]|uniref:hypothetical protein n=1 Tax=Chroococcidiopsis sp. SAG 2025 TaxID=171389 RepID=UPI002936E72B|nr:hypothetical protein [Chroococcidiopsis sp. SAG 2025]MDV2996996.1 hypothetical protein [Chroococcidiopsis sp. SAG 2025]
MKQAQKNISSSPSVSQKRHLDRTSAIAQLEMLGYKRGDAIYIRAFLPKEDPAMLLTLDVKLARCCYECQH